LENARTKARQEAEQAFRDRYGLSADYDPQAVRTHLEWLARDPVGYVRALDQQIQARGLAPPTVPAERPQPDMRAEDGTPVYSAPAMERLLAWQAQQIDQKLAQLIEPLQATHQTVQAQQLRERAWSDATAEFEEAKTWDGFDELRPEIAKLMAADKRVTLWSAYNRLQQARLKTRDEQIRRDTRQATLAELQQAPTPNTAVPSAVLPRASRAKAGSFEARLDEAVSAALAQHSA
jgi:hypothetical protein